MELQDGQLEPHDEAKYGVPKGDGISGAGRSAWFWRKDPFLAAIPAGAFPVTWDTFKPGAKLFGYYESAEEFHKQLLVNKEKCGYELIIAGTPWGKTLVYGDIDHYGERDTEHLIAREITARLHNICETKLGGFKPEVYILCGTRKHFAKVVDPDTKKASNDVWHGVWKNSYHFIIANLYAAQCADAAQFFQAVTFNTGVNDDMLLCKGRSGEKPTSIVDSNVYSTYQNLRMPKCTKRGDDVPLCRINTDPRDPKDELKASFPEDDVSAFFPCLVSIVDPSKPTALGSTMKLLEPGTLAPAKTKRKAPHTSLGADGRAVVPRTDSNSAYSRKLASEVAEWLVAIHPDHVAAFRDSWRDVMFAAIDGAGAQNGAPPEFIEMLQEFTRTRRAADRREEEYPRIANGTYASKRGRGGDGATIGVKTLYHNQREFPAAATYPRASNVDHPLPGCRALLAPDDVWMFELFVKFLRHVSYQKTSFKWLVQFARYVVPKLKAQVYDTFQGGYGDITKEEFDGVWDGGKHSEIYEFAFKRYLADIVGEIKSITPLVETTTGEPDGDATTGASSKPKERVTTVGHVRTLKPTPLYRHRERFTKEQVVALIVKISPDVHSLYPAGVITKAVRGALEEHEGAEEEAALLVDQWKALQGNQPSTGAQPGEVVRGQTSTGDASEDHANSETGGAASEEHSNDESMEVTSEECTTDGSAEVASEEQQHSDGESMDGGGAMEYSDDESMDGDPAECGGDAVMSDAQVCGGGGDDEDFKSLQELASCHPNCVWKRVITDPSPREHPTKKMLKVFLENLDLRQVSDDLTLIRTCCLLKMATADDSLTQATTVPAELLKFLERCSVFQGRRFDGQAVKELKVAWGSAWEAIETGPEGQLFADALWLEIFKRLFSYKAVQQKFEERNFKISDLYCFASITSDGKPTPRKESDIRTNYRNLWCWIRVVTPASDDNEEEIVEFKCIKFLSKWFDDVSMKTYTRFDCLAPGKSGPVVSKGVFNTWPGFAAEKLPAIPDDEVAGLIEPIMQHFRLVICSTEEQVQYQLAWWARQVQDPSNKTQVAIVYMGDQGVGKDIVTGMVVEKVFGFDVATQSDDVVNLFDKHSLERENKVLCVLDEADAASLKPYMPHIKGSMVGSTMSFNPKNGTLYKLNCIINYMYTSNKQIPVPIEASDRRYVVYHCNNSKKGNTDYFNNLLETVRNPRAARALFQFLQNFDLSNYGHFQACRPETAMYRRLQEMELPLFYNFLSFLCNQQADSPWVSHQASTLFAILTEWVATANFNSEFRCYSSKKLGQDLTSFMENHADSGVTKDRKTKGNVYFFDGVKLKACLKRHNLYNSNV
jgi:hypothetical protein